MELLSSYLIGADYNDIIEPTAEFNVVSLPVELSSIVFHGWYIPSHLKVLMTFSLSLSLQHAILLHLILQMAGIVRFQIWMILDHL